MLMDQISRLPVYEIPERYRWRGKEAVALDDMGFVHVYDCLHKNYGNKLAPFPKDFDQRLFKKGTVQKTIYTFIDIDPNRIILAQQFLHKGRLLQISEDPNPKPIVMRKIGDYNVMYDGHHRLALRFLRGSKVYAKLRIMV